MRRNGKRTSPPHPNLKGKISRHLECMQSFPWLYAISLHKTLVTIFGLG